MRHRFAVGDRLHEHLVAAVGIVLDDDTEVGHQDQPLVHDIGNRALALRIPAANLDKEQAKARLVARQVLVQVDGKVIGLRRVPGIEAEHQAVDLGDILLIETPVAKARVGDVAVGLRHQVVHLPLDQLADDELDRRQATRQHAQLLFARVTQYRSLAGDLRLLRIRRRGHQGIVKVALDELVGRAQTLVQAQVQIAIRRYVDHQAV